MLKLNIKNLVDQKFQNKNQFAKAMQLTFPAACKLYDGDTSRINFDTLELLCLILECTPNEIFISDKIPYLSGGK